MVTKPEILHQVKKYIEDQPEKPFVAGETYVIVSEATWNADDICQVTEVLLDRWYDGKTSHDFERLLATITKQRHVTFCNSGSSANLLAISSLMSKSLGNRRLKPGEEVITVAAGFPTTVNPIVQNGRVPVFVDVNLKLIQRARSLARRAAPLRATERKEGARLGSWQSRIAA